MSRIVITHVGTSLLTSQEGRTGRVTDACGSLVRDYNASPVNGAYRCLVNNILGMSVATATDPWAANTLGTAYSYLDDGKRTTLLQLVDYLRTSWQRNMRGLQSAEISSLYNLDPKLKAGDEVVLFASDTVLGCLSAVLIRDLLLTEAFPGLADCEFSSKSNPNLVYIHPVERIKSLELKSQGQELVSQGLKGYLDCVRELYHTAKLHNHDCREAANGEAETELVFNITGGYKAIIPFASILAMSLGSLCTVPGAPNVPDVVCSLFIFYEEGSYALQLHGLAMPIEINMDMLDSHREILDLADAGGLTMAQVGTLTPYLQSVYLKDEPVAYTLTEEGELARTLIRGMPEY